MGFDQFKQGFQSTEVIGLNLNFVFWVSSGDLWAKELEIGVCKFD